MITPAEIERVLEQLDHRTVTAREAVSRLIVGGFDADDAEEMVFVALGGSDIIEGDRYRPSGRHVNEVEADMQT